MKRHIPNIITSLNLFSGCLGITFMFNYEPKWAVLCMLMGAIFDFFDGFAARLLKVGSSIGKELDSLADMISFGLLPSVILYQLLLHHTSIVWLPYTAFLSSVFSAIRLAKFNVDTEQSSSFKGLPTPASAIFVGALPFIELPLPEISLPLIVVTLSILMVSNLPLFALKFSDYSWANNKVRYIFLICAILLIVFIKIYALPAIILLYVLLSIISRSRAVT